MERKCANAILILILEAYGLVTLCVCHVCCWIKVWSEEVFQFDMKCYSEYEAIAKARFIVHV